MIEYALLIAGSGLRSFATTAEHWASDVNWNVVAYLAAALLALRIAFWAFSPRRRY